MHAMLPRCSLVAACLLALSACAATTYDESLVRDTTPSTSTTVPQGTTAELLARLEAEAGGLSTLMIDGGDAASAAARIEALWAAARAGVQSGRSDLIDGFDQAVAKCTSAVQYKRAADADKAAKNISALVAAFSA